MDAPSQNNSQDPAPAPAAGRFRPYASTTHRVTRGRYITSNDRRGYIPVYEYPLNGQWIMMDIDDGYILWTGIWKALGNAKADIVKMLESQPDLATQLRRVRGGYLKIQGTWMPYEVALRLARRVAWSIREDLVPLFGPTFPSSCLTPDQPGYGQILGTQQNKRRGRRAAVPLPLPATLPPPQPSGYSPGNAGQQTRQPGPSSLPPLSTATARDRPIHTYSPAQIAGPSGTRHSDYRGDDHQSGESSRGGRYSYTSIPPQSLGYTPHGYSSSPMPPPAPPTSYGRPGSPGSQRLSPSSGPIRDSATLSAAHAPRGRFSPYGNAAHGRHRSSSMATSAFVRASPIDLPPLTIPSSRSREGSGTDYGFRSADNPIGVGSSSIGRVVPASTSATTPTTLPTAHGELITLPPIQTPESVAMMSDSSRRRSSSFYSSGSGSRFSLPPISSLNDLPPPPASGSSPRQLDSAAVLKRLALDDDVLGESRQNSSATVGDTEGSHRDYDDDGAMFEPPTQEQLWKRRRSLSEPPLYPEAIARTRPAWSAAPNISLDMSGGSSIARARPSSFVRPLSSAGRGLSFSGTRSPPSPPRPNTGSPFTQQYMSRSSPLSRSDFDSGSPMAGELTARTRTSQPYLKEQSNDYMQGIAVSSSRTELLREGLNPRPTSGSGERGVKEEGARTPRPDNSSTFNAESWRPHAHSRVPTPLGRHTREHSPYSRMHPLPQSSVDLSSYRFGMESTSSLGVDQSLSSPRGRETQDEQRPFIERKESDTRFHSSAVRHIRSEDLD